MQFFGTQYTTGDEIRFLRGLGGWRTGRELPRAEYLAQLRQYRATMATRARWGQINPAQVREWVERELAR